MGLSVVPNLGSLIIWILLFRILYQGSLFSETQAGLVPSLFPKEVMTE